MAQLVIVRFHRDECIISVDAAGALLHRRGYRQAVARAPLRETIAAAMLLGCGWKVGAPLLDPLCGSGTIPIEAALIARNIAPGLANPERQARDYAFQRWPLFEPRTWEEVVGEARTQISGGPLSFIGGSDRDAGAVASAIANARRAGVAEDLHVRVAAVSDMECAGDSGWIVTNPPYGIRVGESAPLRNLYAALGRAIRTRCGGWSLAMLSADPRLAGAVGTEWREVLRTSNGGLPVHLLVSRP